MSGSQLSLVAAARSLLVFTSAYSSCASSFLFNVRSPVFEQSEGNSRGYSPKISHVPFQNTTPALARPVPPPPTTTTTTLPPSVAPPSPSPALAPLNRREPNIEEEAEERHQQLHPRKCGRSKVLITC
ncbi:hypothetical protein GUJ93_ZPchr0013g37950 [Zizania palustris]|uniref:Uncharacterized protein n=1 Tax=Zizania palustris TaxID=103762 RepID=A0A8J6BYV1_ZIZPA|nr:hypothetical protein GUJ93_ZPchr0013g37950 [Zizania palustris]